MLLKEGQFTIDRRTLIDLCSDIIKSHVALNIESDLKIGGEYILSAEDLLEAVVKVPSKMLNEAVPEGFTEVHRSIIKITYKQP